MSNPERIVSAEVANVVYTFDGGQHRIKGNLRMPAKEFLDLYPDDKITFNNVNPKPFLHAQMLFWNLIFPRDTPLEFAQAMLRLLRGRFNSMKNSENSQDVIYPREIFGPLEDEWRKKYASPSLPATPSAARSCKRQLEQCAAQGVEGTQQKRAKEEEAAMDGLPEATSNTPQETQKQQAQLSVAAGHERSPMNVSLAPARSAVWQEHWQKIEAFRLQDYYNRFTGSYTISCTLIEGRYPGLDGCLRLHIDLLFNTVKRGLLKAKLELGLFTGIMIMAMDSGVLSEWCYHEHRRSDPQTIDTHNPEMDRLRDESEKAQIKAHQKILEPGRAVRAKQIDTSKPAHLYCAFRLEDEHDIFIKPDTIFADHGEIVFTDLFGHQFDATFSLPMLSSEPVKCTGYKIDADGDTEGMRSWADYDTSTIRYGAAWNQS